MGLKEHQQEEETLEARTFALMITLEAKWWPSCLGSVSVCEKLIKIIIIIICCCWEEAHMTCTQRGRAREKTGRFWLSARSGPIRSGLKEHRIQERKITHSPHIYTNPSQIPQHHTYQAVQQHILTLIGLYHNTGMCLVLSGEGLPCSMLLISTRVCSPICRFRCKDGLS